MSRADEASRRRIERADTRPSASVLSDSFGAGSDALLTLGTTAWTPEQRERAEAAERHRQREAGKAVTDHAICHGCEGAADDDNPEGCTSGHDGHVAQMYEYLRALGLREDPVSPEGRKWQYGRDTG